MYFKGDKLFWFLRYDFLGAKLLKPRSTRLRKMLLKTFQSFINRTSRVPSDTYKRLFPRKEPHFSPPKLTVRQYWSFRDFLSEVAILPQLMPAGGYALLNESRNQQFLNIQFLYNLL